VASIIKVISKIFTKTIEQLDICLKVLKSTVTYLFAITIAIKNYAELLILIGSVILIVGVLFKNPTEIINDSILAHDGPGMITGIYYPGKIQEFIRSKNKVILGLIILLCGFIISASSSTENHNIFLIKWILLTLALIYIVGLFIAGYNRQGVITNWKDNKCRYHWLVTDFLDKKVDVQDLLNSTYVRLNFIKNALSIEVKSEFKDDKKPSLQEIEILRLLIKKDIENTSVFYYFLKPKRLLKDLFLI
jgi:hypothetical protein